MRRAATKLTTATKLTRRRLSMNVLRELAPEEEMAAEEEQELAVAEQRCEDGEGREPGCVSSSPQAPASTV